MYNYILNQFSSNDSLRPHMSFPKTLDGFHLATNGYSLIRIPECLLDKKFENEKFPTVSSFFIEDETAGKIELKVSDIAKVLGNANFCYRMKECKNCKGSGEITCEACDNTHDCKHCEGTGESDRMVDFDYKISDHRTEIKLANTKFSAHMVDKLFISAAILKQDTIQVINYNSESRKTFFRIKTDVEGQFIDILLLPII